jgi:hypothetical protein
MIVEQVSSVYCEPNDNKHMVFKKKWHVGRLQAVHCAVAFAKICGACIVLWACSPTFNWREVDFEQAPAQALLPCKPDRGSRTVELAGHKLMMHMAGCEAGGAMFAVALVELPQAEQSLAVLGALKDGTQATHRKLLSHGNYIVQASVYGQPHEGRDGPGALSSQAVETFLSSLRLSGAK